MFLLIKESWCLRGYDKVLLSVLVDWAEQNSEANPRQSINATQTDIVLQLQVSRTTFHDFRTRSSNKRHSSVHDHKLCTHKSFDVSPLEVSVRSKGPFFETPEVLFAMENILYL